MKYAFGLVPLQGRGKRTDTHVHNVYKLTETHTHRRLSLYTSDNTVERMHKSTVQEAGENTIGRHEYLLLWIVRRVSGCDANQRGKKFTDILDFFLLFRFLVHIHQST